MVDRNTIWATIGDRNYRADESPDSLSFSQSVKLAEVSKIDGPGRWQHFGRNNTTVDIGFTFNAGWSNPDREIKIFQDAMNVANPMFLTMGSGRFTGYYLIKDMSVNIIDTLSNGQTITAKVSVKLVETPDRTITTLVEDPYVQVR